MTAPDRRDGDNVLVFPESDSQFLHNSSWSDFGSASKDFTPQLPRRNGRAPGKRIRRRNSMIETRSTSSSNNDFFGSSHEDVFGSNILAADPWVDFQDEFGMSNHCKDRDDSFNTTEMMSDSSEDEGERVVTDFSSDTSSNGETGTMPLNDRSRVVSRGRQGRRGPRTRSTSNEDNNKRRNRSRSKPSFVAARRTRSLSNPKKKPDVSDQKTQSSSSHSRSKITMEVAPVKGKKTRSEEKSKKTKMTVKTPKPPSDKSPKTPSDRSRKTPKTSKDKSTKTTKALKDKSQKTTKAPSDKSPKFKPSKTPKDPRDKSPKVPKTSRSKSPKSRDKSPKAPKASRSKSPMASRSKSPKGQKDRSAKSFRGDSPLSPRGRSLKASRSKSPKVRRSGSPLPARGRSLKAARSKSPKKPGRSGSPLPARDRSLKAQRDRSTKSTGEDKSLKSQTSETVTQVSLKTNGTVTEKKKAQTLFVSPLPPKSYLSRGTQKRCYAGVSKEIDRRQLNIKESLANLLCDDEVSIHRRLLVDDEESLQSNSTDRKRSSSLPRRSGSDSSRSEKVENTNIPKQRLRRYRRHSIIGSSPSDVMKRCPDVIVRPKSTESLMSTSGHSKQSKH